MSPVHHSASQMSQAKLQMYSGILPAQAEYGGGATVFTLTSWHCWAAAYVLYITFVRNSHNSCTLVVSFDFRWCQQLYAFFYCHMLPFIFKWCSLIILKQSFCVVHLNFPSSKQSSWILCISCFVSWLAVVNIFNHCFCLIRLKHVILRVVPFCVFLVPCS